MEDEGGPFGFGCLLHLTEALALTGDTAAAREVCEQLEADRHLAFAYLEPEQHLARAWVAASEGTVGQAIEICHQAATEARRLGQPAHEVAALHAAVRLGAVVAFLTNDVAAVRAVQCRSTGSRSSTRPVQRRWGDGRRRPWAGSL
jgi:hypothetical protein